MADNSTTTDNYAELAEVGREIINSFVFVAVSVAVTVILLAKSYLENVFDLAFSFPRVVAAIFVGFSWLFALLLCIVPIALVPASSDLRIRTAFIFAAVSLMFGPLLVLTPTKPHQLTRKNLINDIVRVLHRKESRYFATFLFFIITALQCFVLFTLFEAFNAFGAQIEQTLAVVIGYALVCVFYLLVFYQSMTRKPVLLGDRDVVDHLRRKAAIPLGCRPAIAILQWRHYAKLYMLWFVLTLLVSLGLIAFVTYDDMQTFAAMAVHTKVLVIVYVVGTAITCLANGIYVVNAALKPVQLVVGAGDDIVSDGGAAEASSDEETGDANAPVSMNIFGLMLLLRVRRSFVAKLWNPACSESTKIAVDLDVASLVDELDDDAECSESRTRAWGILQQLNTDKHMTLLCTSNEVAADDSFLFLRAFQLRLNEANRPSLYDVFQTLLNLFSERTTIENERQRYAAVSGVSASGDKGDAAAGDADTRMASMEKGGARHGARRSGRLSMPGAAAADLDEALLASADDDADYGAIGGSKAAAAADYGAPEADISLSSGAESAKMADAVERARSVPSASKKKADSALESKREEKKKERMEKKKEEKEKKEERSRDKSSASDSKRKKQKSKAASSRSTVLELNAVADDNMYAFQSMSIGDAAPSAGAADLAAPVYQLEPVNGIDDEIEAPASKSAAVESRVREASGPSMGGGDGGGGGGGRGAAAPRRAAAPSSPKLQQQQQAPPAPSASASPIEPLQAPEFSISASIPSPAPARGAAAAVPPPIPAAFDDEPAPPPPPMEIEGEDADDDESEEEEREEEAKEEEADNDYDSPQQTLHEVVSGGTKLSDDEIATVFAPALHVFKAALDKALTHGAADALKVARAFCVSALTVTRDADNKWQFVRFNEAAHGDASLYDGVDGDWQQVAVHSVAIVFFQLRAGRTDIDLAAIRAGSEQYGAATGISKCMSDGAREVAARRPTLQIIMQQYKGILSPRVLGSRFGIGLPQK